MSQNKTSALGAACAFGFVEIAQILLAARAEINIDEVVHSKGLWSRRPFIQNIQPLYSAAEGGNLECVRFLISARANLAGKNGVLFFHFFQIFRSAKKGWRNGSARIGFQRPRGCLRRAAFRFCRCQPNRCTAVLHCKKSFWGDDASIAKANGSLLRTERGSHCDVCSSPIGKGGLYQDSSCSQGKC